jgi:hypothetical protein
VRLVSVTLAASVVASVSLRIMRRMQHVELFLSSVSDEFRSYRDALRKVLKRPNVDIHVQENFIPSSRPAGLVS